jgi:hypothetical protein
MTNCGARWAAECAAGLSRGLAGPGGDRSEDDGDEAAAQLSVRGRGGEERNRGSRYAAFGSQLKRRTLFSRLRRRLILFPIKRRKIGREWEWEWDWDCDRGVAAGAGGVEDEQTRLVT